MHSHVVVHSNWTLVKALLPLSFIYFTMDFYYSILGLKVDCTDEEIRKYFRRQAVLVHPDKV